MFSRIIRIRKRWGYFANNIEHSFKDVTVIFAPWERSGATPGASVPTRCAGGSRGVAILRITPRILNRRSKSLYSQLAPKPAPPRPPIPSHAPAGMKKGGIRRLVVPPELGYGPEGKNEIPPRAACNHQDASQRDTVFHLPPPSPPPHGVEAGEDVFIVPSKKKHSNLFLGF